jgi:hypothetical protein
MVHWNPPWGGASFLCRFIFFTCFKSVIYIWKPNRFRLRSWREIVSLHTTYRALPKTYLFDLGFLPLLPTTLPPYRLLHPVCQRASANGRACFRNLLLLWSARERIRFFFFEALRCDCSRSSP